MAPQASQFSIFILVLEAIIISGIIFYQLYISLNIYKNISSFKSIFSFKLIVNNENRMPQVEIEGSRANSTMLKIKENINKYLTNNFGADINFSIIKDMIEREVEVKEEEISNTISTPLYLGLAGAMTGIILGLISMPSLSGARFNEGIDALINGVKLAMTASLFGLLLTTILSSVFYKNAKNKVLVEKSDQLSYLTAELLPELIKGEVSEITGLKRSLDNFSRDAKTLTESISDSVSKTHDSIKDQLDVLEKVESIGLKKIVNANVTLLSKLDENMSAFNAFADYLILMKSISENLSNFSERTSDIDTVINKIDTNIEESNRLSQFLTSHFDKIKKSGSFAEEALQQSEAAFSQAINALKLQITTKIAEIGNMSIVTESTLRDALSGIGKSLQGITENHINKLNEAYEKSIPNFNNLEKLSSIETQMNLNNEYLKELAKGSNAKVSESLLGLNESIKNLNDNLRIIIEKKPERNIFKRFFSKLFFRKSPKNKLA